MIDSRLMFHVALMGRLLAYFLLGALFSVAFLYLAYTIGGMVFIVYGMSQG